MREVRPRLRHLEDPGRGLLHAAQPVRRPRHPRRRARHCAARGAAPQRQGRVDRLPRQPRPAADDALNREVFEESMEIIRRALANERFSLPRQALRVPATRHPRSGLHGAEPHARAAAVVPVRDLAGGHLAADPRLRPGRRPRRGVLEPALLVHQALLGQLRRELRGDHDGRAGPRREAHAGDHRARRGHLRGGGRRRCRDTTSSGSSSGRTAGAAAYMGDDGKPRRPV